MNLWNEFRYDLVSQKNKSSLEEDFQFSIETGLRVLGWSIYDEILHMPTYSIGNGNSIKPDIVLMKDNNPFVVFEIKKPDYKYDKSVELQLASYVKHLNLSYGIFIGEDIRVIYIKDFQTQEQILRVDYSTDNALGREFISMLTRNSCSFESFIHYCDEKRIHANELWKIRALFEGESCDSIVKDIIKDYYSKSGYSDEAIADLINGLYFSNGIEKKDTKKEKKEVPNPLALFAKKSLFSLNGSQKLKKNQFFREVVRTYMNEHPNLNFEDLEQVFHPEFLGHLKYGAIRSLDYIKKYYPDKFSKNGDHRFYMTKKDHILVSKDGVHFATCTQWKDFSVIIKFAIDQGWKIK